MFKPNDLLTYSDAPDKKFRQIRKGERLAAGMVRVGLVPMTFRKLKVGDRVEEGQLIALVDPKLALDELEVRVAKLEAATAERRAAEKTKDEAKKRYEGILATNRKIPNAVGPDEQRAALLTWERYIEEENVRKAGVWQADRELNAGLTLLRMHEIRSPVTGVIRKIYKQRGEAVRKLESVVQIEFEEEP